MSTQEAAEVIAQRWRGTKVIAVGAIIAGVGFAAMWFFAFKPAAVLFVVGWLVGVAGGVIHIRQMFASLGSGKAIYTRRHGNHGRSREF
jgi:hypothetical protein